MQMIVTEGNRGRLIPEMSEPLEQAVLEILRAHPDEALLLPRIIETLAAARVAATTEADITLATPDAESGVADYAISHNLDYLKGLAALDRPLHLVMPLRSIALIVNRIKHMKVLTIGPRTESEIFTLVACGFDPANITAIDLISYSDLVDTGDMHDMPYADNSFDVVIMGWVLAYSDDPVKAVREARRVARSDAVFAVGCEYSPLSDAEQTAGGSLVGHGGRYDSADDILTLFEGDVGTVWFRQDIDPSLKDKTDSVMAIFKRKGLAPSV